MISIVGDRRVDTDEAMSDSRREGPINSWRLEIDPFAHASPVVDLSMLVGGLPDDRDAEAILRDLDRCHT